MDKTKNLVWVAEGANVLTAPQGDKRIEELEVGDIIVDHGGAIHKVLAIQSRAPYDDEVLCALRTKVMPDDELLLSCGAVVLDTPWFNSNPERWKWESLLTLNFGHNCLVVFHNGYATGASGSRSMPLKGEKLKQRLAGKKLYALLIDGEEQAFVANCMVIKAKVDVSQDKISDTLQGDLKKCPFCGETTLLKLSSTERRDRPQCKFTANVTCLACGAQAGNHGFDWTEEEAKRNATIAWNRRAT